MQFGLRSCMEACIRTEYRELCRGLVLSHNVLCDAGDPESAVHGWNILYGKRGGVLACVTLEVIKKTRMWQLQHEEQDRRRARVEWHFSCSFPFSWTISQHLTSVSYPDRHKTTVVTVSGSGFKAPRVLLQTLRSTIFLSCHFQFLPFFWNIYSSLHKCLLLYPNPSAFLFSTSWLISVVSLCSREQSFSSLLYSVRSWSTLPFVSFLYT